MCMMQILNLFLESVVFGIFSRLLMHGKLYLAQTGGYIERDIFVLSTRIILLSSFMIKFFCVHVYHSGSFPIFNNLAV